MDSNIEALSWFALTKSVLFTPKAFFAQFGQISYRSSLLYLAITALVVSLVNALVLTLVFYVLVSSFASILTAFTVIFGTLLTPLIAVAANIPPDKVPAAVEGFAKNGGLQVSILSARLGAFLFVGFFGTLMASTSLQAGIAHCIARLLGSTGTFRATAVSYSFASAAWTLSIIPVVNLIAPIYGVVLDIIAMRHLHQLSYAKTIVVVAIATAVPVIGFILYCSVSN